VTPPEKAAGAQPPTNLSGPSDTMVLEQLSTRQATFSSQRNGLPPPIPGPRSTEFRIPRLPTGTHTPSPGGHSTPVAHTTLATPPPSPGRVAEATDAQSVGRAVSFVPAPVPWADVAAPPPGRDGPFMPQARPAASSEAATRRLSLPLPPWPGGLTADLVWAGGRATQGGGGSAVGLVEETSDLFAPRRVAVFAARGGWAAVPEPRQVAGIRPRTARAVEARATRAEKKARLRKPQVWLCKTCKVDCSSAKNMLAHKTSSRHQRKAAKHAGTPNCGTCDRTIESAGHLATHMQSRRHASTAVRMNLKK